MAQSGLKPYAPRSCWKSAQLAFGPKSDSSQRRNSTPGPRQARQSSKTAGASDSPEPRQRYRRRPLPRGLRPKLAGGPNSHKGHLAARGAKSVPRLSRETSPRSSNTSTTRPRGATASRARRSARCIGQKGSSPLAAQSGSALTRSVPSTTSKGVPSAAKKSSVPAVSHASVRMSTGTPSAAAFSASFLRSSGSTASESLSVTRAPLAATASPAAPHPAPSSSTLRPRQKPAELPPADSRASTRSQKASAASQTTAPKPNGKAFSQFVASCRILTLGNPGSSTKSDTQASLSRTVK
mmetsp:Transcript_65298/g.191080  ORF Transcript_65298/g.191080 Transcript_65298/m.191080 type:complete len:296 (+) Transcript_65298:215-1102(+)